MNYAVKRRENRDPGRYRFKKLGTPVYIAPGKATEDGKGGKTWQELPE
jgi:hypothetical protein